LILGQKLDKSIDFHSCQDLLPRNCFFDIQGSWTAKYMIQRCTHFILPYLSSTTKENWQIYSCQDLLTRNCFFLYLGSMDSYILYTYFNTRHISLFSFFLLKPINK
jgi:hypothetical protein